MKPVCLLVFALTSLSVAAESMSYNCHLEQGTSQVATFQFTVTDRAYYFDEAPLQPGRNGFMSSVKFPGARIRIARTADPRSPGAVVWIFDRADQNGASVGYRCL
jgi:hypothetical protein